MNTGENVDFLPEDHTLSIEDLPLDPERYPLLSQIRLPGDVAALSLEQMPLLAAEVRDQIIQTVSRTGGHLAPSLGVVDLTIALLASLNPGVDRIVWDVGHQAYAWKILTGRAGQFHSLREHGGLCGFPKRDESLYDDFGTGHSSTSISAALGMAVARDLKGEQFHSVAVIGDGSLSAGMAFEALNHAGHIKKRLIVILNDNEMSIAKNVGALSLILSRNLSSNWMLRAKRDIESFLTTIPAIGEDLVQYIRRSKRSFKAFFTPGMLFEAFGFNYIGLVDGHNIEELLETLETAKAQDSPVLVHVATKKGKGDAPAEENPVTFHGVGSFEPESGLARKRGGSLPTYTDVFSGTLCRLGERDERIVAITAAMPEGTGTREFASRFPDRFVDVGICEQQAITFAAGLATQGLRPVVALYSTFLQRGYDQLIHDVCLQNLPVVFAIDRAGLVGEDGATHHGVFDLSFLRAVPNLSILAPRDEGELQDALYTALNLNGPAAVRYPRGVGMGVPLGEHYAMLTPGLGELLRQGRALAVIACGSRVHPANEAAERLYEQARREITVFDARWVKPLPERQILDIAASHHTLILAEENALIGGFTSGVLECLADNNALNRHTIIRVGIGDHFVEHGPQKVLREQERICIDSLVDALKR